VTDGTRIVLDPAFRIGELSPRLFGSFVEHMGRCVYTGLYEPGHPRADVDGFRGDVLDLVAELGVGLVRYPGGNFVSGYRWEDSVGPRDQRPTRLDPAWRSLESNEFGLGEFMTWVRQAGVEPMLAVNLGTRGAQEAAELLEYCNYPGGTQLSDLRIKHGATEPYGIKVWCLGNEMDGPWQIGHRDAASYGQLAAQTAHMLRRVDPSVELVACGSSNRQMPTFAAWEAAVLEHCYDLVDYVSAHAYYEPVGDDIDSFLASAVDMDAFIEEIGATIDHVKARRRSRRQVRIAFDEWNVWRQHEFGGEDSLDWAAGRRLIEDEYNVFDAAVVGSFLISLIRHADRVAIGCQAQLVNVIAPIRTEPGGPAWRQTIFHPFADAARLARGDALRIEPSGPCIDTARYGPVPAVCAAATVDDATGKVAVFLVNRDRNRQLPVELDTRAFAAVRVDEHRVLYDDDPFGRNTADQPDRITPRPGAARIDSGTVTLTLEPASWTALTLDTTPHP
jgi:alpha-N-arabinofuranosidase